MDLQTLGVGADSALDNVSREVRAVARFRDPERCTWQRLRVALLRAAEALRLATGQSAPPIQVDPILPLRKIAPLPRYFSSNDSPEAVLVSSGTGFFIRLRPGLSECRCRWSKAHELAHTFFYDLTKCPPERVLTRGLSIKEEGLCNDFAAELLMPLGLVTGEAARLQEMSLWAYLHAVRREYGVSTETAARRLLRVQTRFRFAAAVFLDATRAPSRAWWGAGLQSPRARERAVVKRVQYALQHKKLEELDLVRKEENGLASVWWKGGEFGGHYAAAALIDFSRSRSAVAPPIRQAIQP